MIWSLLSLLSSLAFTQVFCSVKRRIIGVVLTLMLLLDRVPLVSTHKDASSIL